VTFPARLAVASKNAHKRREIARICADWPVTWLEDADWPDVDEPHETYLENALAKALAVSAALGVPALADDSGIEVDALGGGPGPRSARFAGEEASDQENLARLVEEVGRAVGRPRTARYRCVAAVAWPGGETLHAEGVCEGSLVTEPSGERGFGYDPIFVPVGFDRTMAELTDEEKDRISHRGRALTALGERLATTG
jgi:XTP/dITP diphosphohydrolase